MLWFFLLVLVLGLVFGWHVRCGASGPVVDRLRRVLAVHAIQAGERLLASCSTRTQHASRAGAERVDGPGEGVTGAIALPWALRGAGGFQGAPQIMWRGGQFRSMRRVASTVRKPRLRPRIFASTRPKRPGATTGSLSCLLDASHSARDHCCWARGSQPCQAVPVSDTTSS
jgi:hypothetical protein